MHEPWVNPFRRSEDEVFDEIAARRWTKVRLRREAAAAQVEASASPVVASPEPASDDEKQEADSDSDAGDSESSDVGSIAAARSSAARPKKAARRLAVLDSFLAAAAALPDPVKEEAPIAPDKKKILDGFLAAVGLCPPPQEETSVPPPEEKGGWSELPSGGGAAVGQATSSGLRIKFGNSSSASAKANSSADAAIKLINAGYQNAQQQMKLAKEASAQAAANRSSDAALRTALGKDSGRGRSRSRRRKKSRSGSRDRRKRSRSRRRSRSRKRNSNFDEIDEDKVVESLVSSSDLKAAEQLALSRRMTAVAGASGDGQLRPGDWTCPVCSAHNFASKFQCFRCQKAKNPFLDSGPSKASPPPMMMMGSSSQSMKVGDWLCSRCSAHNFASKFQCFRCSQGRNPMLSDSAMAGLNLPPQAQIGGRSAAGLALKAAAMAGRQAGGGFNTQAALQAQAAGLAMAVHSSNPTSASSQGFSRAPAGFSNGPSSPSTGTTLL